MLHAFERMPNMKVVPLRGEARFANAGKNRINTVT